MNEVDIKVEEKKNIKLLILAFLIVICVPIILVLIYVMYWILGTNSVNLKNINNEDKNAIIEILNLKIENIEFEKIETPKTYRDIYYDLYVSIDSKDKQIIKDIKANNIVANFYDIKEKNNRIMYRCNIYSEDEKSIELLEQIMNKY